METTSQTPDQPTELAKPIEPTPESTECTEESKEVSLDELVVTSKSLLTEGDFEKAVQSYGQALQIAIQKFGEMDVNTGNYYYSYGHALLTEYENND
jgi:hypothetical protein